jgi:superoxide reductase
MTELKQIYKCNVCGNMVEMVHTGAGELICCGENMERKQEKNEEEGLEKHRPVIERTDSGVIVKVGSVPHPMAPDHYIEWIEVITEHRVYRKNIAINQDPWAEFFLEAEHIKARAYCNIHGLWSSEEVINS